MISALASAYSKIVPRKCSKRSLLDTNLTARNDYNMSHDLETLNIYYLVKVIRDYKKLGAFSRKNPFKLSAELDSGFEELSDSQKRPSQLQ